MFDVLPFEINNGNYFLLIGAICTRPIFDNFPRSPIDASNLWVVGSNLELVLLLISLEFNKCIFGANVIDFEIFKTVVVKCYRF